MWSWCHTSKGLLQNGWLLCNFSWIWWWWCSFWAVWRRSEKNPPKDYHNCHAKVCMYVRNKHTLADIHSNLMNWCDFHCAFGLERCYIISKMCCFQRNMNFSVARDIINSQISICIAYSKLQMVFLLNYKLLYCSYMVWRSGKNTKIDINPFIIHSERKQTSVFPKCWCILLLLLLRQTISQIKLVRVVLDLNLKQHVGKKHFHS